MSTVPSTYAALSGALTDAFELPSNPPLGVTDLTLQFTDGTPITGNRIPLHNEMPVEITVKFTNKPADADKMLTKVIISQLGKDSYRSGESGLYSNYVSSATYEDTVPIDEEGVGYSIKVTIAHAQAPNSGFHGGDGPYDLFMSLTPTGTGGHEEPMADAAEHDEADAAEHDEDDDEYPSQVTETLRYKFYDSDIHFLACLYYAVWRFWDGRILARLYYGIWKFLERR